MLLFSVGEKLVLIHNEPTDFHVEYHITVVIHYPFKGGWDLGRVHPTWTMDTSAFWTYKSHVPVKKFWKTALLRWFSME